MTKTLPPELPPRSGADDYSDILKGAIPDKDGIGAKPKRIPFLHVDLEGAPIDELLRLHAEIEAILPATSLKDVSLEKTLVLQLLSAQALQKAVHEDDDATPTQKAQVMNATSAIIEQLSKLQVKLFTSERMKDVEGALIDTVNDHMTEEQAKVFFTEYRRKLGAPSE